MVVWLDELKTIYQTDMDIQYILTQVGQKLNRRKYTIKNGVLVYKNKIYISKLLDLKVKILEWVHSSPSGVIHGI